MTIKHLPKWSASQGYPATSMKWLWFLMLSMSFTLVNAANYNEAEDTNKSNVSVASSATGYTGSGYVTGFTSEWSKISFEQSYSNPTTVRLDIRYANGTGSNITNLSIWQGSNTKVQDLVLAPTGSWNTWSTVQSVVFTIPAGYQGSKYQKFVECFCFSEY